MGTHWQFVSPLQLKTAEYSKPHLSEHAAPFHWQVASREQSPSFVFNPHEVLHVWAEGFQAQPV